MGSSNNFCIFDVKIFITHRIKSINFYNEFDFSRSENPNNKEE